MKDKVDFTARSFPWPTPGVPFWGEDELKATDAHIHWIRDLGFDLAGAFKSVGDFAVRELANGGDGSHPDGFALPILYLYRHAIELQLKQIIDLAFRLELLRPSNNDLKRLSSDHSLKWLWLKARQAMVRFWPGGDEQPLEVIEEYVLALDQIDPDGQRFRYAEFPEPKMKGENPPIRKEPAVYSLPRVVGLRYFSERIAELFSLLEGTEMAFDDALSNGRVL